MREGRAASLHSCPSLRCRTVSSAEKNNIKNSSAASSDVSRHLYFTCLCCLCFRAPLFETCNKDNNNNSSSSSSFGNIKAFSSSFLAWRESFSLPERSRGAAGVLLISRNVPPPDENSWGLWRVWSAPSPPPGRWDTRHRAGPHCSPAGSWREENSLIEKQRLQRNIIIEVFYLARFLLIQFHQP